ncbi:sensor histidine kinase [Algoriphagus vanfongensis]|uniref:sensor histidine kinase n=1 Tax=Algoriphagus vanfongensis TaxID=426371 RepID=UPI0003FC2FBC|nr:histidine kinase [Algoriphagus vanfongensis]
MNTITPKKNLSFLVHLLGWMMLGIILLLLSPLSWRMGEAELPIAFWYKQLFLVGTLVLVFYTNVAYFVPKILLNGRNYIYLLCVIGGAVVFYFAIVYFEELIHYPIRMHEFFNPDKPFRPGKRWIQGDAFQVLLYIVSIGLSTSLALVQKWQKDEANRRELEKQQINTELSYLKAQINPHFFFNTLNNIYSLTNLDIKKAQEALLKLSRMMRYVLYENQKENTLLSKEVDFIRDYIELMKIRLTEKVKLNIQLDDPKDNQVIAPMLILPFLENCFKHGISSQKESKIHIKLEIMGDTLFFETRNQIFPINPDSPEAKESGIGLSNTQRRLSLLYPQKHRLKFGKDNNNQEYYVNLTINLS